MAGEDETPFARTPEPGVGERPTPITPMAEVVAANAIARSAGAGSRAARILGVVLLLFVLATVVWGVVGVFFRDDGLDAPPERPPPSSSVTQTVPPFAPALPAPVPSSSGSTRG